MIMMMGVCHTTQYYVTCCMDICYSMDTHNASGQLVRPIIRIRPVIDGHKRELPWGN